MNFTNQIGEIQLGKYYHVDYLEVSFVLLSPVIGYAIAALINNTIHIYLGQRGIAIIGPGLHVISFISATQHPPFPVFVIICMLTGLGSGLVDGGWNAWLGAIPNNNGIMGSLHGFYSLGATVAPLIATAVITKAGWQWYGFYYLMTSAALIEFGSSVAAFWTITGFKYRMIHQRIINQDAEDSSRICPTNNQNDKSTLQALGNVYTWLISAFIFVYAGIEISLADWILTLLVDVRHRSAFDASMVTTGYWGGFTIGRILLGFLISYLKIGHRSVTLCLLISMALHVVFWAKDDFVVSAISIPLLGFFLGPLFPEAVVMQTKLVPKHLHVAAVGIAVALGSAGGCVFPFIIGSIAKTKGIEILQPVILVMLLICQVIWLSLSSLSLKTETGRGT